MRFQPLKTTLKRRLQLNSASSLYVPPFAFALNGAIFVTFFSMLGAYQQYLCQRWFLINKFDN
jgi:hypothetical protein